MNSEELKSDVEVIKDNPTNGQAKGDNPTNGQMETSKHAVEIEEANFQWETNQVWLIFLIEVTSPNILHAGTFLMTFNENIIHSFIPSSVSLVILKFNSNVSKFGYF